ncbi:MAG: ABC transporter permease [Mariprofundaceae bacterium]|nr:ABC transporter permease [Mariprofundaceae bacterium]
MYSKKSVTYLPRHKENLFQGLIEEARSLWESREVGLNLFRVRLRERYEGSYLGVAWSVLAPVLTMIAIALVFPLLMRVKVENYVIYLFSGLLVWRFVSSAMLAGGESVLGYKELIQKAPLPTMLYPMVVICIEFINFILVMACLYVVATLFNYELHIHPIYLLGATFVTMVFSIGVAALFSVVITFFRDIRQILDVIVQAFFYLTPIIYPISMIPDKYHSLMELNIFYQFVRLYHQAIYSPNSPDWHDMLIPALISCVVFVAGLIVHRWYGRQLVFRL